MGTHPIFESDFDCLTDMIQRLSKNVVKLLANNASPMTNTGTNCYLIGSGSDRILIDTGSPDDESCIDALSKFISSNPIKVSKIICTHWHPDHTGGVSSLSNITGNIFKHPQVEYTVGRSYPNAGEKLPSGASYKLEKLNWNDLSDNDVISVEPGLGLEILFTPGHANDHICLWLEADNVLFSGDNILGGSTAVFDNYFEYMKSLIRIRDFLSTKQNAKIYPGHGEMIENGLEMVNYYIEHRLQRENQILSNLSKSEAKSVEQLVEAIYVDLNPMLIPAASINVLMTLDKLLAENKVIENDHKWTLC